MSGLAAVVLNLCPPFYLWLFLAFGLRFIMIEMDLDRRCAGLLEKTFETFAHVTRLKDQEWSELLKKRSHDTASIRVGHGEISQSSIKRHSWLLFEWFVDCTTLKEHYKFEKSPTREDGSRKTWIKWRHRSLRTAATNGDYTWKGFDGKSPKVIRTGHSTKSYKFYVKDQKLVKGQMTEWDDPIIMVYGTKNVEIPGGEGIGTNISWNLFKQGISIVICFSLFGAGLLYLHKTASIAFIILTNLAHSIEDRIPDGEPDSR